MSEKLIPADPEKVMVIRDISPNVVTFSVPFLRFGKFKVGGRATVVKLQSGSLAVFSPVALTPTVQEKLRALSPNPPTTYIIAPDIEHHIFLAPWYQAYQSSAHVIGMEGLPEKRAADKSITVDVPFKTIFTKEGKESVRVTPEFDQEFEYEYVDAHPNKELVFFHKPSQTLIEADLLFNLPATEQYSKSGISAETGGFTRLFAALQNTRGKAMGQKRVLWYGLSKGDREGFNKSVKRIGGWGFENLIPCHGDSLVGDGKGVFEKVMQWHLEGKK